MSKVTSRKSHRPRAITADDLAIAEQIRTLRAKRGLTMPEVARRTGYSRQQIQKYETGWTRLTGHTLMALARALQVSPTAFFETCEGFDGARSLPDWLDHLSPEAIETAREYDTIPSAAARAAIRNVITTTAEAHRELANQNPSHPIAAE